ncbi:BolA-like protein [Diplocarpon rosae]|nr:BolA-like protein [Diplocarpon rosae]
MERAATANIRRCLRNVKSLRCAVGNATTDVRCVGTATCPRRISAAPTKKFSAATIRRHPTSLRPSLILRSYSSESSPANPTAPEHLNAKERQIWEMLMRELQCTSLEVQDISGGCGSMYGIDVVSERFRGLGMLKQQRLVNEVLAEEIKGWHGVQLKTRAP